MGRAEPTPLETDDAEHPVPKHWQTVVEDIVEALAAGDFEFRAHPVADVEPIDHETAKRIEASVVAYGDTLAPLDERVWEHSIYRWMDGYWQVLVDLSTAREPVSDLALHGRISASGKLTVNSVHVP